MVSTKKVKLIQTYLDSMPTYPPISPQTIEDATLRDLRPRALTQAALADLLGRDRVTVNKWEQGIGVDRIKPSEILQLAILFKRDIVEIHAAIENTKLNPPKKISEEDNNQTAPPLEVVQR